MNQIRWGSQFWVEKITRKFIVAKNQTPEVRVKHLFFQVLRKTWRPRRISDIKKYLGHPASVHIPFHCGVGAECQLFRFWRTPFHKYLFTNTVTKNLKDPVMFMSAELASSFMTSSSYLQQFLARSARLTTLDASGRSNTHTYPMGTVTLKITYSHLQKSMDPYLEILRQCLWIAP